MPFDEEEASIAEAAPTKHAGRVSTLRLAEVAGPIDRLDQLVEIKKQFVEIMGDPLLGDPILGKMRFSDVLQLYTNDIKIIANKNQDFRINSLPRYEQMRKEYETTCKYMSDLANKINYKSVELGTCADHSVDTTPDPYANAPVLLPGRLLPTSAPEPGGGADLTNRGGKESTEVANSVRPNAASPLPVAPPPAVPATPPIVPAGEPTPTLHAPPIVAPSIGAGPAMSAEGNSAKEPSKTGTPPIELAQVGDLSNSNLSDEDKQHIFDLVTSYMFYQKLAFGYLDDILISPSDFLDFLLVCFCGILGALLRIVFYAYVSGKDASARNLVVGPILGLIAALVVYVLLRAGFIAITDKTHDDGTSILSPFFIAFISIAAGLLSERAVDLFTTTTGSWLGSAEASHSARWAVGLGREVIRQDMTMEKLAEKVDVSAGKLREWAEEKSTVPIDKQREIGLALNIPFRSIFTDIPPIGG